MTPLAPESAFQVAQVVQQAVAPVFLLAGVGAFLNVCALRLARIVDRARLVERLVLETRGTEHDRAVNEIRVLDRRMALVSWAIFLTVLSAVMVCTVVVLLFAGGLTGAHVGTAIALLFIGSMVSLAIGFALFLFETRFALRNVRIDRHILEHEPDQAVGD
jgi:cytochrome c biogenesis protein CcdA